LNFGAWTIVVEILTIGAIQVRFLSFPEITYVLSGGAFGLLFWLQMWRCLAVVQLVSERRDVRRRHQRLQLQVPGQICRLQLPDGAVAVRLQAVPQRRHLLQQRHLFDPAGACLFQQHDSGEQFPLPLCAGLHRSAVRGHSRLVSWAERAMSQWSDVSAVGSRVRVCVRSRLDGRHLRRHERVVCRRREEWLVTAN